MEMTQTVGVQTPINQTPTRGQAVVLDAIFFLMICGIAAAFMLWASSVYGNKSFEAFRYLYLNDFETASLAVLSSLEYNEQAGPGEYVSRSWLDELGRYMVEEFSDDPASTTDRYDALIREWQQLCHQAPAPMLLTVYSESEGVKRGTRDQPLRIACGQLLDPDWEDADGNRLSLCEDDACATVNEFKYPYYGSAIESKSCNVLRCETDIKIYY
jgi:hypothetical protein